MLDVSRSDLVAPSPGGTMGRGIVRCLRNAARARWFTTLGPGLRQWPRTRSASRSAAREKGRLKPAEVQARSGASKWRTRCKGLRLHVVIEAIVEDLNEKGRSFSSLENVVAQSCILASNTSSLSVTQWRGLPRPGRVAGYHFFQRPSPC